MTRNKLSSLQRRILGALTNLDPPPTLIGGAALIGFHLGHRQTRDVDLVWQARAELDTLAADAVVALRGVGLGVDTIQETPSFLRLRVMDGPDICLVDLVADPAFPLAPPLVVELDGRPLQIETRSVALVGKLCALLGRSEIRDLVDVKALIEAGEDIENAIAEAPLKDGGFSPLTLAWLLNDLKIEALARSEGLDESELESLKEFRDQLVTNLLLLTKPT